MRHAIFLIITLIALQSCGTKKEAKVTVYPANPEAGSEISFRWSKPAKGFLWLVEYYGDPPVYRKIEIIPINGQKEFSFKTDSSAFLVFYAFEDTAGKIFYTNGWEKVLFYLNGKPDPRAFYILIINDMIEPDSVPENLKESCHLRGFFLEDRTLEEGVSEYDSCNLSRFMTAYTILHDSSLADKFYRALEGKHRIYADLILSSISPSGRIRKDPESVKRFWKIYKSSDVAKDFVKNVRLFRWFVTLYFQQTGDFELYRAYINSLDHLTLYDFYVMESEAVYPEVDTAKLSFILEKEKKILFDPVASRWDFAFRMRKPEDFERVHKTNINDYTKNLTRLYLAEKRYEDAYSTLMKFIDDKDLFTLWAEDLILYGKVSLRAGKLDKAEKSLSIALYFHQDTTALPLLKELWKRKGSKGKFDDYLDTLKVRIDKELPEAPDFTATTLSGKTIKLSDLRGKPVVLNFWATWCSPCRREIPELNELVNRYRDKAVFLAFTDEDEMRVKKFLENQPFEYEIVVESKEIRKLYHVNAFPTHFVISPAGYIAFKQVGYIPGTSARLEGVLKTFIKD